MVYEVAHKRQIIFKENDYFLKIGTEKEKCVKCEEVCKKSLNIDASYIKIYLLRISDGIMARTS